MTFRVTRMLANHVTQYGRLAVAVSGGVDSLTLGHVAHRLLGKRAHMWHAVSPAVPEAATDRVLRHARKFGWKLSIIEAGEFADGDYLSNPINRCFYCKSNLYRAIGEQTDSVLAAGTNLDDLSDFRPGLDAAKNNGVVHPFVEAGLTKKTVRLLARGMRLSDLAELPAQPCLASRIQTGVPISARDLKLVEDVESVVDLNYPQADIRCRVSDDGVRLELSSGLCEQVSENKEIMGTVKNLCAAHGKVFLGCAPYRRGSAFVHTSTV